MSFRDILNDAIRYWEFRRIAYNGVLAAVVIAVFVSALPESRSALSSDTALGLFLLAVLANVAYCAAYFVDIFVQLSEFQSMWRRHRWVLFSIGLVFAGIIAMFISSGIFSHAA